MLLNYRNTKLKNIENKGKCLLNRLKILLEKLREVETYHLILPIWRLSAFENPI